MTADTDTWRLICPANDPESAREFVGASSLDAARRIAEQLGVRHSWDEKSRKFYVALPEVEDPVLDVPWYYQFDSRTDQGGRMCFSASNAMLLKFLKPGALSDSPNADDEYLARLRRFGDTTNSWVQVKTLAHFGIKARFTKKLGWDDLDEQLAQGRPVPIGILHKGRVSSPRGGGHWIIVIGKAGESGYYVNDPAGELDLVAGRYVGNNGHRLIYSKENLGPRWLVEGPNRGWGIVLAS